MRKSAFSLLELIFVIVIIGTLSGIAFKKFKPHYLHHDMDFMLMKLEETRYKAMAYDKSLPNLSLNVDYSIGCIDIDTLNDTYDTKTNADAYKFHAVFKSIDPSDLEIICFDSLGRVHDGEDDDNATTLDSLLSQDVNITYEYNGQSSSLIIDHFSGTIR